MSSPSGGLKKAESLSILNETLRKSYEDNGYFVVKRLVPEEKLNIFRKRFGDLCNGKATCPGLTIMQDVGLLNKGIARHEDNVTKIQDFQFDNVLFKYCSLPEILYYVQAIVGSSDIMAMHTMLINKPPDPGTKTSRHPMHQDLHYFPFRPADAIVCSWTAMQPVTRKNGCLVVVPGTHKGNLLPHGYPNWKDGVNKLYHGIQNFNPDQESMKRVHLEMDTGDTVFFHPLLIHGSGMNRTNGFRKAISCHYASAHCEYVDVGGTTQEDLQKELLELVEKRYGKETAENVSFADLWRFRSRIVKGQEAKL